MTGSPDDPQISRTPERPTAEPQAPSPAATPEPPGSAPVEPAGVEPTSGLPAATAPVEPEGAEPVSGGPASPAPGHASGEEAAPAEPEVRVADVVDRSTVRHAPRYGRFILAGVVLGAVVSGLLALLTPSSQYSPSDLFWILFLLLGFVFGLAAAGLAVVLDRRSIRRRDARTAERLTPPEA